jgi:NAD(P)-dependent dehydrogenase (short-subunit alcohol dehydrogenase family)
MTRVVFVTGSTDGIGRQTARTLAAGGSKVILHGRNKPKLDAVLTELRAELPGAELDGVSFDLGSLASVQRGADQLLAKAPELHVLLNNAGIFASERSVTGDGIELTLAVNHIGGFVLTELLLPRLLASAGPIASRVINVASVAHSRGRIHLDDLQLESAWTGYAAYAQSKLANVMHASSLAERHDPAKLVAYSLHPGVIGTKLLRQGFGPIQGASLEVGARTSVRLAAEELPVVPSGSYFSDGVVAQPSSAARDDKVRERLWEASMRLGRLAPP